HPDFAYHEQPGAAHWWGNPCVDWPPLMEFLRARTLADRKAAGRTSFTTCSPGVSASPSGWARVEEQIEPLKPGGVEIRVDREKRVFTGTTSNGARLSLAVGALGVISAPPTVRVELDGQSVDSGPIGTENEWITLSRDGDRWGLAGPVSGV